MRRMRRVGFAVVAALLFSSTAYAFNPLLLLPFAFPFRTAQKTQTQTPAAASSAKSRPEVVVGKGYDARNSTTGAMGTRAPSGYNPTKTRFWK